MQKDFTKIKKIFTSLLFLILLFLSIVWVNHVVMDKELNRYYMLKKELTQKNEPFDVEVFGSCHAYTSFNPIQLEEEHGYTAYNLANPSEIIPISYVRMVNQFHKDPPEVAVVEIWGVHPYNTYVDSEDIFESYSPLNVGALPLTREKNQLIQDFDEFDLWNENFPLARYKNRVIDAQLNEYDFHYSFEKMIEKLEDYSWQHDEMWNRFNHNGSLLYTEEDMQEIETEWDGMDVQGETLEIDEKILGYVDKMIDLCEKKNVKLIFYRAPYHANETERMQANFLENYLAERNIPYYDTEKYIAFDPLVDFRDENHLAESGNRKVTEFLGEKIAELMAN